MNIKMFKNNILIPIALTAVIALSKVNALEIVLTQDGPVISGGIITFQAHLRSNEQIEGLFRYKWNDDVFPQHHYESPDTSNISNSYSVVFPKDKYSVGTYNMEVVVCKWFFKIVCLDETSARVKFQITSMFNGHLSIEQKNMTLQKGFIAANTLANLTVNINKPDLDFIKKGVTSIMTYWFINCKAYNQSHELSISYNFTTTNTTQIIQALVIVSYDTPVTTTPAPSTTSTTAISTTTSITDVKSPSLNNIPSTHPSAQLVSTFSTTLSTTPAPDSIRNSPSLKSIDGIRNVMNNIADISPKILSLTPNCIDTNQTMSPIANDNKTYGYFQVETKVRDPITHINVTGITWIQPYEMLSLKINCPGSGPFRECHQIHVGAYNVTGNESCQNFDELSECDFTVKHWFLDPVVHTFVFIISNQVSTVAYPVRINFYKVTSKPQLSVIIVPVSCSLVAVVVIIFGIAYYIQSRSRYTIEVADFEFGQVSAEVEYKTFTERLRDSFNHAMRTSNERGYKHLNNDKDVSVRNSEELSGEDSIKS